MVWDGYVKPFNVLGNLYFAGTVPASTHLLDTGDGLILFDTGYQHSLYLVLNNIWELGFSPYDIKYLIHTHGHIDHMGATRALVELTGAKTFIGEEDADFVNGKLPLSYAKELNMDFRETFEADVKLRHGDVIKLGNTEIFCYATPGHTPGAMTYFFNVTDGSTTYRAGLHGGMGMNTMCREYLDAYGLSYDCRTKFKAVSAELAKEKVDITLGNHMKQTNTPEKAARKAAGEKLAFVDPAEWAQYVQRPVKELIALEEKEADEA